MAESEINKPCPKCGYQNRHAMMLASPGHAVPASSVYLAWPYVWLVMLISFLVACLMLVSCQPIPSPPIAPVPPPVEEPLLIHDTYQDPVLEELYQQHVAVRAIELQRVPKIRAHLQLDAAAQRHADWMAENDKMSHTGAGGSSFWDRLKQADYHGRGGGENIAAGYKLPKDTFRGWMNSEGHRRNILNPDWDDIGLAYAKSEKTGRIYWCAVFAYGGGLHKAGQALPEPARLELPEPLQFFESDITGRPRQPL
jgi:uncharacterized protein YkwD